MKQLRLSPVYSDRIRLCPRGYEDGWSARANPAVDKGRDALAGEALLSREIASALRGRGWEVPIYPFSFAEALLHKGAAIPAEPGFMPSGERARIEKAFTDWLVAGGFPEAQFLAAASRKQLLTDCVDVALLRDVVERHKVSNVTGLRWLVRHLLCNAAGAFRVEKFYAGLKSQGIAISKDTIHRLLGYLEDCFLVRIVWMESTSERRKMVNPRKSYPVDPGLIPLFDRTGKRDIGRALETEVLIGLERRRYDVAYVCTGSGYEIDFLARDAEGNEELIQVCADASDPDTACREFRALEEAGEQHPRAKKRLLVSNTDSAPASVPDDVILQPAYERMLAEQDSNGV